MDKNKLIKNVIVWNNKSFLNKQVKEKDIKIRTIKAPVYIDQGFDISFEADIYERDLAAEAQAKNLAKFHQKKADKLQSKSNLYKDLAYEPPGSFNKYVTRKKEIAQTYGANSKEFLNVINEGYPEFRLSASNSKIKASLSPNTSTVTLTYSDITSVPKNLNTFTTNLSQTVTEHGSANIVPILSQKLLQLGVVGDGPKVHKFCEEALRCYIYYKYIQRKRGVPANEKQMAKRAYYNEKRLARARMMSFNKETAMAVSRKAFKQSPKM